MDDTIRIERLSDQNFSLFTVLFSKVFGKELSELNLIKKYNSPALKEDRAYFGFLAIDKNEAVSYCGAIVYPFNLYGNAFLAAHSCDHMTLSAYRGKGLFQRLNAMQEALLIEKKIPFLFGFPNQNNAPILFKKSNWVHLNTMHAFEIKIMTIPVLKIQKSLNLTITEGLKLDGSMKLLDHYTYEHWNGMCRNLDVFENKNDSNKFVVASKHGTTWLKKGPAMFIGDFQIDVQGSTLGLIEDWKMIARKNGSHKIVFLCSDNHPHFKEILSQYQSIKANLVGYKLLDPNLNLDFSAMAFSYMDYDTF